MKAIILHESKGRIRFRIGQKKMTLQEADVLENWFQKKSWITQVTVHERTGCVILQYSGSRKEVLAAIREFNLQEAQSQITLPLHSSRELNRKFQEKLVGKVVLKAASMLFLPKPLQIARIVWHMLPFLKRGIHCLWRGKLKVDVLDALSIGIRNSRNRHVSAGTGRTVGRMDQKKINGRPCSLYGPECGSGMAEDTGIRNSDSSIIYPPR